MGNLRMVPKHKEPGFIKIKLEKEEQRDNLTMPSGDSHLSIRTRWGTVIRVGRDMPLKQVARFVRMLEGRGAHDLG